MIIYRVCLVLDSTVEQEWLAWMHARHIPDVLATGCFTMAKMYRVHDPPAHPGSVSYEVQYEALHKSDYERYINEFAPRLRQDAIDRFGGKFTASRAAIEPCLAEP